jgi:ATP-binding cassette, subfamily C (CFTR/MRP), member 1
VNPDRKVDAISVKLQSEFQRRLARGDKYPLVWAIHETFKFEFWIGGICRLIGDMSGAFTPFVLRYLVQFATDAYNAGPGPRAPHIWKGLALVFGISLMQLLQSLANSQFNYRGMIVGGQCRAALIAVIFGKSLRISGRAKAGGDDIEKGPPREDIDDHDVKGWSNGKVTNLMAMDTNRIDLCLGFIHFIWTAPVLILTILVLLLVNLTYSALAGFIFLLIGAPILAKVVQRMFAQRDQINRITDQRVSLTQEILQGVRFVKYFSWEDSFLKRLGDIRKREIWAIQILLASRNAINAVSMVCAILKNWKFKHI